MPSFDPTFLQNLSFTARQAAAIRRLGMAGGRQQLFVQQVPEQLESLRRSAATESVESSNRIEGVTAAPGRVAALVEKGGPPRDRSEHEIAGYRDALNLIHESHAGMTFTPSVLLQFHSTLFRYLPGEGGRWKPVDNEIVERDAEGRVVRVRFKATPAVATPQAMATLTANYDRALQQQQADPLVLIPLAVLDLLCIHPFRDGNGRVARLSTLLLLYHADYRVGRYISLERVIEESRDAYYEALERSSQGWHENRHDPHPWLNYFWDVLIRAYDEFEQRIATFSGSKTDQVRRAVLRRSGPFGIQELSADCPNVSLDMVRHVLRQLKYEGAIVPVGFGRGTRWCRRDDGTATPEMPQPTSRADVLPFRARRQPAAPVAPIPKRTPQLRTTQRMSKLDADLRRAIAGKRLLRVTYKGNARVAEPHDYGVQNGTVKLLTYQLRGSGTRPGKDATGWRMLEVSKITDWQVLDEEFPGSRGEWHEGHLAWESVYARVAGRTGSGKTG